MPPARTRNAQRHRANHTQRQNLNRTKVAENETPSRHAYGVRIYYFVAPNLLSVDVPGIIMSIDLTTHTNKTNE